MLCEAEFSTLIESAPLVSIDIVLKTDNGILLGKRIHEPARGYWFTPGGRVFKNESIAQAMKRISFKELGKEISIDDADFLGVHEHFYENSFVSEEINTHYVVLVYEVECELVIGSLPTYEHNQYDFFKIDDIKNNTQIHDYTKAYFKK